MTANGPLMILRYISSYNLNNTHFSRHPFAVQGLLKIFTGGRGSRTGGWRYSDVYIWTVVQVKDVRLTRHKKQSRSIGHEWNSVAACWYAFYYNRVIIILIGWCFCNINAIRLRVLRKEWRPAMFCTTAFVMIQHIHNKVIANLTISAHYCSHSSFG